MSETRFMQGNEAIAEGAIAAGVRFFAGYPITPASEISEVMSIRLPEVGGIFMQMEDELASMAAIAGASMGGVKAMTATSGPGFSLMQENLGYACMTEMPCVIADIMRMGPASGMPTYASQMDVMQARWGTHGDHPAVALCPATVQEAFDLTVKAVNISEYLRTPVILIGDAVVGHIREKVTIPDPEEIQVIDRKYTKKPASEYKPYETDESLVPEFAPRGTGGYRYHICSNVHLDSGFPADSGHDTAERLIKRLEDKIRIHKDEITFVKNFMTEDADVVIVAYGCSARASKDAVKKLREMNVKAGLLQLQTIWPFPKEEVSMACRQARLVVVPEMNFGQIVDMVMLSVPGVEVAGVNKTSGIPISPEEIIRKVREEL